MRALKRNPANERLHHDLWPGMVLFTRLNQRHRSCLVAKGRCDKIRPVVAYYLIRLALLLPIGHLIVDRAGYRPIAVSNMALGTGRGTVYKNRVGSPLDSR